MRRLIVNADDFGMSVNVNEGIIKAHRDGIVTSTTILACGAAAEHAATLAKANPTLGVGLHLCLTGSERSVLDPTRIPSLTRDGLLLPSSFHFMLRMLTGRVDMSEVEAELRAQFFRALEFGIAPTHIDGHQHQHMMPGVLPIALNLARDFGITAIRYPAGPWVGRFGLARDMEKMFLEGFSRAHDARIREAGLRRPDAFFGLVQTGNLGVAALREILDNLPDGTSEVMCHPGIRDDALAEKMDWGRGWETELAAVTDPGIRALITDMGIELISYRDL
ncbi:MAG: ChbG/HpnK family deacetylase [Nitrospirae bacterium]|nr:ChbG/HpnK family deacetylase [Nitrospirota bacterium]